VPPGAREPPAGARESRVERESEEFSVVVKVTVLLLARLAAPTTPAVEAVRDEVDRHVVAGGVVGVIGVIIGGGERERGVAHVARVRVGGELPANEDVRGRRRMMTMMMTTTYVADVER